MNWTLKSTPIASAHAAASSECQSTDQATVHTRLSESASFKLPAGAAASSLSPSMRQWEPCSPGPDPAPESAGGPASWRPLAVAESESDRRTDSAVRNPISPAGDPAESGNGDSLPISRRNLSRESGEMEIGDFRVTQWAVWRCCQCPARVTRCLPAHSHAVPPSEL